MIEQPATFSVIIPTYARPVPLRACLHSLAGLNYPRDRYEVIVVDDGSPAPLDEVVAGFRDRMDLTLLRVSNGGPASARNAGVGRAKGRFLAFTDDDCTVAPDWLAALAVRFAAAPDALVGGRVMNSLTENVYSTASQMLVSYLYGYYNTDPDQAVFFTSNNIAVSACAFREAGGFDSAYMRAAAEDREFCDRWRHQGRPMIYAAEAIIHHAHHLTLRKLWRQQFSYGRGAYHFRSRRRARADDPIRVEPAAFYYRLLGYPFSQSAALRAVFYAGLLLLTQVANAAGFFWERATARSSSTSAS